jgi:mycothiol synthase
MTLIDRSSEKGIWLDLPGAPSLSGLRFRRPSGGDDDYDAMARVITAANRVDEVPWQPTGAQLREDDQSSSGFELARDVLIAEIDGRVVAEAGVERVMRAGRPVYDMWGHVDPAVRRRGIGRAMLAANLRRVQERVAEEDAARNAGLDDLQVRSYVEVGEIGHRTLLEAAGFTPVRWFFRMRHDALPDVAAVPLPDGLELRPVRPEDHRRIIEAEHEAFRDHWEARDFDETHFSALFRRADLDTDLWVVAWDGDEVAGVVQNWIWRDENARLGVERGWLEHISVRRPWRRRGLGRAITAESLRRLRAAGMTEAMLGVDADNPTGALGLYEGLGFIVDGRAAAYGRPLPT